MSQPSVPWEQFLGELEAELETDQEQPMRRITASVAGNRLTQLRKRTSRTQADVAKDMGVDQARVSAIEQGDRDSLTPANVRDYVEALGGSVRLVARFEDFDVTLRIPGIDAESE